MQEHFAINVCPGPILPIPNLSDFFPRYHAFPTTPPPPREKPVARTRETNREKDEERQEDRDEWVGVDSDDDDSEWLILLIYADNNGMVAMVTLLVAR